LYEKKSCKKESHSQSYFATDGRSISQSDVVGCDCNIIASADR